MYKVVTSASDCHLLQQDLSRTFDLTAARWVHLNAEALNITNKRAPLQFEYILSMVELSSGNPLYVIWVYSYVNSWSDHCKLFASKATKLLDILRRAIFGCSMLAKGVACIRVLFGLVWSMYVWCGILTLQKTVLP